MPKVFLYDPGSINNETLQIMRRKEYACIPLTDDPKVFWGNLEALKHGDILVLLSHGDAEGPLAVKGQMGDNIDLNAFIEILKTKSIQLYLLSCHTGLGNCAKALGQSGINFVAPLGTAVFEVVGSETINVGSEDDKIAKGWIGTLAPPGRSSKKLSLP